MKNRVKFKEIISDIKVFNANGFRYPKNYKLNFPVFQFCRYCKKPFFTNRIHVYESNDIEKIICSCTKCGGRHKISIKTLLDTRKAYKVLAICAFVLIAFFFLAF